MEEDILILARQNLNQKIREIEKEIIYKEYSEMLGEIVVGDIYQIRKNDILVNHNKNEFVLPRIEQIQRERYRKGDTIRAVIKEIRKTPNGPMIIISVLIIYFLKDYLKLKFLKYMME